MCKKGWLSYITTFVAVMGFDRWSKWWALANLQHAERAVFPGLNFSLMWNRGVSWGMFNSASSWGFYLLTGFIISIILSFIIYTIYECRRGTFILFELMVIAGAISNIIDRIQYGAVVDFIDVYCNVGGWVYHWPTFNIADTCIVIGIGGIVVKGLLWKKKET